MSTNVTYMGRLPEAWIARPRVREARELIRYRWKLVALRTSAKTQVHAVLGKAGVHVPMTDVFSRTGPACLAAVGLGAVYRLRVDSLLRLVGVLDDEVARLDRECARTLADDPGYRAVQTIPGIGPVLAATMLAEIGDVTRFPGPAQLSSWAGLTPCHRASDTKVHRGPITKQGATLLRWACVEAVQRSTADTPMRRLHDCIINRRGTEARSTAKTAAARKLLTLVYTRCATEKSAAWRARPRCEQAGTRPTRDRGVSSPRLGGVAVSLIDPVGRREPPHAQAHPAPSGRAPAKE
ncbi:transposase [Streptomyces sp. NEAU-S7GS2]|uniref:transposase n=1 Tax=Streptomyces sp. NEAU-S7GS2 TaxID=2202000 RepID=UPI0013A57A38|nr:transposase [Streptomyces sp. NEAU-S7GS2]